MIRFVLTLLSISLALLIGQGCGENNDKNPTDGAVPDSTDTLIHISGITQISVDRFIVHSDPDDWCVPSAEAIRSELPTEYALYPAYPNPSYQQVLIHYDLPASSHVTVRLIDSTNTTLRTLVDVSQDAGRYVTSWDRHDKNGLPLDPGIYRLIMEAESFTCHGDIQLTASTRPSPDSLIISAAVSDTVLTLMYNSEAVLGGLDLVLSYQGILGTISYGPATNKMSRFFNTTDQTVRILFLPGNLANTMPAGEQVLCTLPIQGTIILRFADASDYIGDVMRTIIVNPR